MLSRLKEIYGTLYGRRYLKDIHRRNLLDFRSLGHAVNLMNERFQYPQFNAIEDTETPVFIFAASWRSGSTFLQRLICSSNDTLIWGEPYGDLGLMRSFGDPVRRITQTWPPDEFFVGKDLKTDDLKTTWIANLYPTPDDLRCAYRAMADRLFADPANRLGATTWGIKEVRVDANDAAFLKWLYPRAKILFLVRNPLDAFRSYSADKSWYGLRPDTPIFTAHSFARHWNNLASSFLESANKLGAYLVKYEDLNSKSNVIDQIDEYLSIEIDRSQLDNVLRGTGTKEKNTRPLLLGEESIVKFVTRNSRAHFGYT